MPYTATDAKKLVLTFLKSSGKNITRTEIAFQTKIAKALLEKYTVEEVLFTLEDLKAQGRVITSLGYIQYVIDKAIIKLKRQKAEQVIQVMEQPKPKEVNETNNKFKAERFGVKKDWGGWGD